MISDPSTPPDSSDEETNSQGIRTLSDAKVWLARMAENGVSRLEIKEPYHAIGGGLLIVTAVLAREDGARVNIEVYCYDDRELAPAKADLFPLSPAAASLGAN